MWQSHVFVGAHLDQAADGARKLLAVRSFAVELLRLDRGRQQQLYPMIVKHVDEPGKASRGVTHVWREPWHARHDDDGEPPCQLKVVELRARLLAKSGEIEPDE